MKLHELAPAPGTTRSSYRRGRGIGSGNGKTAGSGHKGQKARAGKGIRPGFEGGQMPLHRRMPKRGFNNKRFAQVFTSVNLYMLNGFEDGDTVDAAALTEAGVIRKLKGKLKILGSGELTKKLTVKADAFSQSASEKIEKAGGKAELCQ